MDGKKEGIVNERILLEIQNMNSIEHLQILEKIPLKTVMEYMIAEMEKLQKFKTDVDNVVQGSNGVVFRNGIKRSVDVINIFNGEK